MKTGFYPKLALDGIRKNRRMYLPYLLTCIGMVMMTYIINCLKGAEAIAALPGGETIQILMNFGVFIMAFFSALFLFYTNSFLIRRRKKEFGLYNILGMGKKNIARILLWETVLVAVISAAAGLAAGIAFSKLAELGFVNLMDGEVSYTLTVSVEGILFTLIPFAVIFVLLLINSLRQIWFSNAISLLGSENFGEKPPKANWLFGLLGFLLLGAAYYLAVTIEDPITALAVFFVAVLMVIAATYLILIAGSVLICRILQRRKGYYYQARHFVSVSSMAYRMRRNGAGLASICILATMVLVMIASTSALFIGGEDILHRRYPRDVNTWFRIHGNKDITEEEKALFLETMNGVLDRYHVTPEEVLNFRSVGIAGLLNGGEVIFDTEDVKTLNIAVYDDVTQIYLLPIEDYNAMMGRNVVLAADEALVYAYRIRFDGDTFGFLNGEHYRVKEHLTECFDIGLAVANIAPSLIVVVPDVRAAARGLVTKAGNDMTYRRWNYAFDAPLDREQMIALEEDLKDAFRKQQLERDFFISTVETREANRADFYSLYGGIFYLGIILSIVFVFAAVLIIYYKQISEGYEDQARFEIMQKVGMTKREIRRSINSQLLTVFFLPLLFAGLHLAFAFPIIEKLLLLFGLSNHVLFLATTAGSFLVFALFYVIVYRVTSNAYYQIVSGAKSRE